MMLSVFMSLIFSTQGFVILLSIFSFLGREGGLEAFGVELLCPPLVELEESFFPLFSFQFTSSGSFSFRSK